jgi:nitrate/TMAO reductase-like tetraheme cytochrome c subunit
MVNVLHIKLVFVIILANALIISCNKKTDVDQESSSKIKEPSSTVYDNEWQKGRKLFLETCGICHQAVKKDEIFKRYINSIAELDEARKAEDLSKILAGDKHLFVKDDVYSYEELKALMTFITTPQKTGIIQ